MASVQASVLVVVLVAHFGSVPCTGDRDKPALLIKDSSIGSASSHNRINNTTNSDAEAVFKSPQSNNYFLSKKTACEAGHPCGENQWCSQYRHVCRPCSDLDEYCNQTDLIHATYDACENYCYKLEIQKSQSCEAQKKNLEQLLNDTASDLNTSRMQIDKERRNCSSNISFPEQRYQSQVSAWERRDAEKDTTVKILVCALVVTILWALITSFLVLRNYCNQRYRRTDCENPVMGQGQNVTGGEALLAAQGEAKAPVQAKGTDTGRYAFA